MPTIRTTDQKRSYRGRADLALAGRETRLIDPKNKTVGRRGACAPEA